jgi:hypothetical protein
MNSTPLISVIVPAYNVEKYIKTCLDSLINQTYSNFEIIVINDGSTDQTEKILNEYESNPKIRIFSQKNGGLSAARNQGLNLANGELVCFIDSDDSVKSDYLEKLAAPFFEDSNIDITVCGYQEKFENSEINHVLKSQKITGAQATKDLLIKQQDFNILAWNKLYRKKLFSNNHIEYPAGQIHEDNLTTYKLFSHAQKVFYISDVLYIYQRTHSEITKNLYSKEKTLKRLQVKEQMAIEAGQYLQDPDLKLSAEVASLLAYFAFLDHAISRQINKSYYDVYLMKTRKLASSQFKNPYLTKKLRVYLKLIHSPRGILYQIFRKITLRGYN